MTDLYLIYPIATLLREKPCYTAIGFTWQLQYKFFSVIAKKRAVVDVDFGEF